MVCRYCGRPILEGAKFCTGCGRAVEENPFEETQGQSSQAQDPFQGAQGQQSSPQQDKIVEEAKNSLKRKILIFAILGLVFAEVSRGISASAASFMLESYEYALAGLIMLFMALPATVLSCVFSFRAASMVEDYKEMFGRVDGRALVGKIISIPARILSIVAVVLNAVAFFLVL